MRGFTSMARLILMDKLGNSVIKESGVLECHYTEKNEKGVLWWFGHVETKNE